MKARARCVLVLLALLLAGVTAPVAHAQFTPLLQRIPESANTIFLLNAEKIFNSAVAQKEGWQQDYEKSVDAGMMHLPADTLQYVLAGELDFNSMQPAWQVGALQVKNKRDMAVVAKRLGGKQDEIAEYPAVLLPTGDYVVGCDPTTLAVLSPGGRQAVARWLSATDKATPKFSDYIQEAIGYSEKSGTELILAMDLKDVLELNEIKERIASMSFGSDQKVNAEELAAVLVGMRGIMLGVTLGEKPYGSIKVDFGRDAKVLDGIAKQFLLDALAKHGAMIDDFQEWKEAVKGNQVTFSGNFSRTGLRQVLSLLDAPISTAAADEPAQTSPSDIDPVAAAAKKYFNSIEHYFGDLRDKKPQRIAQYGIWFDKYARKIDQLPMVNVEDDMLNYGAYVSQQLRNAATAIQGIGINSRVRQVEAAQSSGGAVPGYYGANYNGGYAYAGNYYYGYGGLGYRGNYLQEGLRQQQMARTQVKVQEKAAGASAARAIIKEISTATATVRREMAQKHKMDF